MSLPNLLKAGVLALVGWTLLRLAGRVQRLEALYGRGWRVQPPWADPRALCAWELHAKEGRSLRSIGEILNVPPETARQWVKQGQLAHFWAREDEAA